MPMGRSLCRWHVASGSDLSIPVDNLLPSLDPTSVPVFQKTTKPKIKPPLHAGHALDRVDYQHTADRLRARREDAGSRTHNKEGA